VGNGPLDALPLLAHLRRQGAVAIQIDRVPRGMRSRDVSLFGRPGQIPEGPLKLAELSGAPIIPVFTARIDYRRYRVEVAPPIDVPKRASDADLDAAAQRLATAMSSFLRSYPTGWFHFGAR
jgi:phosphatidylinositol dimannoside acyltransferase